MDRDNLIPVIWFLIGLLVGILLTGFLYRTEVLHCNTENVTVQESCDVGKCYDVRCAMNTVCNINKNSQACDLVQLRYATCMSKPQEEKN